MSPKTLEVIPFIIFYTNLIDHVVEDTLAFETALHTDWENNSVSSYTLIGPVLTLHGGHLSIDILTTESDSAARSSSDNFVGCCQHQLRRTGSNLRHVFPVPSIQMCYRHMDIL